ncbi:MAG: DUF6089 family protein [Sediminibacterium sp.]|nr:DUF6089 family protein [Sediminibacterium sp.]
MSLIRSFFFVLLIGVSTLLKAQDAPLRFKAAMGLATYYGDLKEKAKLIDQSSLALNLGLTYDITEQILGTFDFSILSLKANDKFNTRIDYINRNLNFKTTLWEANFGVEYDFLNMTNGDYILTPYLHMGVGLFHFNPWTYDRNGNKVFLRQIGTEGQGLPSYPELKPYNLLQMQIPIGGGIKFAISEDVNAFFDITFRKIFTDYIDDVGNTYPDRDIVLAESPNPIQTIGLTYRGDEISSAPYPGVNIKRGGYSKDIYYTLGLGVSFRLNDITFTRKAKRFNGKVSSTRSRLRSPGSVL